MQNSKLIRLTIAVIGAILLTVGAIANAQTNSPLESATQVSTLNLKAYIQGLYNTKTASMKQDTVRVYLRNSASPYTLIDSSKSVLNASGNGTFAFSNALNNTNYYVVIRHRNSIETWSLSNQFSNNVMNLDMTFSSGQAYGNNLIKVGNVYCIYSGDINQDGTIDITDVTSVNTDNINFKRGYLVTDLNGDEIINTTDLLITYNNSSRFVEVKVPEVITLVYPQRNSTPVMNNPSGDVLILPYTQLQQENGAFRMYYVGFGNRYTAVSPNGLNGWSTPNVITGNAESIITVNNKRLNSGHRWISGNCWTYSSSSNINAYTFTDLPTSLIWTGEDRSMILVGDSVYCYIRPNQRPFGTTNPRKIGLMTCSVSEFGRWTPIRDILIPNVIDGNKQLYSMMVSKIDNEYWGLLNVMIMGTNGLEGDDTLIARPPYSGDEFMVECQVVYSPDGRNWRRCNNQNRFLEQGNMKQVYGMSMIQVGDNVMIHSIDTERRHTTYDNIHINGKWFGIWNHNISVTNIKKFK